MQEVSEFRSNAAEAPVVRRWFIVALALSILLHFGMTVWFRFTALPQFAAPTERLVPRAFKVNRLDVDARLLDEEPPPEEKIVLQDRVQMPAQVPVTLEEDRPIESALEEVRLTPSAPEVARPILSEKPRVDAASLEAGARIQQGASKELERDLAAFQQKMLKDEIANPNRPTIRGSDISRQGVARGGVEAGVEGKLPGYSDLDELLSSSGGVLKGDVKPIYFPGGALFDFDRYDLRPEAMDRLGKLAKLIEKNPRTMFSIEGHTDTFGTPEYNLRLSELRAEAVKAALVSIGVKGENVSTKGFGSTRLIVQPSPNIGASDADIAREQVRQAANRRVEIVIRTPAR